MYVSLNVFNRNMIRMYVFAINVSIFPWFVMLANHEAELTKPYLMNLRNISLKSFMLVLFYT